MPKSKINLRYRFQVDRSGFNSEEFDSNILMNVVSRVPSIKMRRTVDKVKWEKTGDTVVVGEA